MSMPNKAQKYGDKAVIEPARVIQERKDAGLHPTCPVPAGAIMCYDNALWQWICDGNGYVEGEERVTVARARAGTEAGSAMK